MKYIIAILAILTGVFAAPEQIVLKTHSTPTYDITAPDFLKSVDTKHKEMFVLSDVNSEQYQRGLLRGYEYKGMGKGLSVDDSFCRNHFRDFSTTFYESGGTTLTLDSLDIKESKCIFHLQSEEKVEEGLSNQSYRIQTVFLQNDSEYMMEAVYSNKDDSHIFISALESIKIPK